MAINVNTLFLRVKDLSRKDKAGYLSNDEFNRNLADAQDLLMEYYYQRFEEEQDVVDALHPFITEVELPIGAGGIITLPGDYRHRLDVLVKVISNADECGGEPSLSYECAPYVTQNELSKTFMSALRRPSLEARRFVHEFLNSNIRIHPMAMQGEVVLKYLRNPSTAFRAVTIDVINDEENYDPISSVDLEWDAHHLPEFVDVMLWHKGIQVRETALLQWVGQKSPIINQITDHGKR